MTTLKVGDRVVINNSEDNNPDNDNEGIYIGTTSYGTHIVEQNKGLRYGIHIRSSALDPVEKWEAKVGEEVEAQLINESIPYQAIYCCENPNPATSETKYIVKLKTGLLAFASVIRPIRKSAEEELRELLNNYHIIHLMPVVMQWHNRNKEGEGR